MNLMVVEWAYPLKMFLAVIYWFLKVLSLRRAVAGHCPKKCSDTLKFGHILVRDLLTVNSVKLFIEYTVNSGQ